RYRRQNYELSIPAGDLPLDEHGLAALLGRFHEAHERVYGASAPGDPVELVNFRVTARGRSEPLARGSRFELAGGQGPRPGGEREVYFAEAGGFVPCPVYWREELRAEHELPGPLIVEQMDATTVVHPGQLLVVDLEGNLLIAEAAGAARAERRQDAISL